MPFAVAKGGWAALLALALLVPLFAFSGQVGASRVLQVQGMVTDGSCLDSGWLPVTDGAGAA